MNDEDSKVEVLKIALRKIDHNGKAEAAGMEEASSWGNSSDAWSDGMTAGEHHAGEIARQALKDIGEEA